jgi:hypothetical protein
MRGKENLFKILKFYTRITDLYLVSLFRISYHFSYSISLLSYLLSILDFEILSL